MKHNWSISLKVENRGNSEWVLQGVDISREERIAILVREHYQGLLRYIAFLEQDYSPLLNHQLTVLTIGKAVRSVENRTRGRYDGRTSAKAWLFSLIKADNKIAIWKAAGYLKHAEKFSLEEIAFILGVSKQKIEIALRSPKAPALPTINLRPTRLSFDIEKRVARWLDEQEAPSAPKISGDFFYSLTMLAVLVCLIGFIRTYDSLGALSEKAAPLALLYEAPDRELYTRNLIRLPAEQLAQWQNQELLGGHTGWVNAMEFAPGGDILASGGIDGTVRLWQMPEGSLFHVIETPFKHAVSDISFAPEGDVLAIASLDGALSLFEMDTEDGIPELIDYFQMFRRGNLYAVEFSPNSRYLVGGTERGVWVGYLDENNQFELLTMVSSRYMLDLAFSPVDTRLYIADITGVYSYDWDSFEKIEETLHIERIANFTPVRGTRAELVKLAASPDGRYIAWGGDGAEINIVEVLRSKGEPLYVPILNISLNDRVRDLAFSTDSQYLAVAAEDDSLHVLNTYRNVLATFSFAWPRNRLFSVSFSPINNTIAAGATVGQLYLLFSGDGQD